MTAIADQKTLLTKQYHNATKLNARILIHQLFSTNQESWLGWVFDHFKLPDKATVLEIGCGPGDLWHENIERLPQGWVVTLADFSAGMVQEVQNKLADHLHRFKFEQTDIQALPFEDNAFDTVIANHILYHVPDRQKAYTEVRRVLRPNGTFFAATNGKNHMRELVELVESIAPGAYTGVFDRFTLEDGGDELADWFDEVTVSLYDNNLAVTQSEPLVAYVASGNRLKPDQLARFQELVERELQAKPAIHITKSTGLFQAS